MSSHITDAEATRIASYMGAMMRLFGLPAWRILIMEDPCDEDANASIQVVYGQHCAQLYLCDDWSSLPDETRFEVITHEVCHILHFRIDNTFDLLKSHKHWRSAYEVYRHETELMVDHLVQVLMETHRLKEAWNQCASETMSDST